MPGNSLASEPICGIGAPRLPEPVITAPLHNITSPIRCLEDILLSTPENLRSFESIFISLKVSLLIAASYGNCIFCWVNWRENPPTKLHPSFPTLIANARSR
jgi:hypothetical protein